MTEQHVHQYSGPLTLLYVLFTAMPDLDECAIQAGNILYFAKKGKGEKVKRTRHGLKSHHL